MSYEPTTQDGGLLPLELPASTVAIGQFRAQAVALETNPVTGERTVQVVEAEAGEKLKKEIADAVRGS